MLIEVKELAKMYGFNVATIRTFLDRYEFTPYAKRIRKESGYTTVVFDLIPESREKFENFLMKRRGLI